MVCCWKGMENLQCGSQNHHVCHIAWLKAYLHYLWWMWDQGSWLIFKFVFIHCKTVKVCQNDQIQMKRWLTNVFLMNEKELRSFSNYQYFDLDRRHGPKQKTWKLTNFGVFFFHCKTVKFSQNNQIRM